MAASGATLHVTHLGTVEYAAALRLQEAMLAARIEDRIEDSLLLLDHPHVFTLGRAAPEPNLSLKFSDVPVFRVSRGGQATYHGPGQLVGYPILKLVGSARDVHGYLRKLEQVLIDALEGLGLRAGRRSGLTGVWVGDEKIGSIGVGIRRWVTYHGWAINLSCDLSYFAGIVPCGIAGCRMTSVAALGYPEVSTEWFAPMVERCFAETFGYRAIVSRSRQQLLQRLDCAESACKAQL
jgi:lipoyl(octanoyl) transferase